jgi:hypothetical protein
LVSFQNHVFQCMASQWQAIVNDFHVALESHAKSYVSPATPVPIMMMFSSSIWNYGATGAYIYIYICPHDRSSPSSTMTRTTFVLSFVSSTISVYVSSTNQTCILVDDEKTQAMMIGPPHALMAFPILAQMTNGFLTSFNNLRCVKTYHLSLCFFGRDCLLLYIYIYKCARV